jgi:hypothetical protein
MTEGGSKTSPYFGMSNAGKNCTPQNNTLRNSVTADTEAAGVHKVSGIFFLLLGFRHKSMAGQMPRFTSVNSVSALRDLCDSMDFFF